MASSAGPDRARWDRHSLRDGGGLVSNDMRRGNDERGAWGR